MKNTAINKQVALITWTQLQHLVSVGAYEERSSYHHEAGTWPEDGVEESVANLETWAAKQGLEFCWSWDTHTWSLEPIEPILHDCPYCHGAHYSGQVCPLSPQPSYEEIETELQDIRYAVEEQDETPPTSVPRSIDWNKLLD